jgi:hypothetical protein
VNVDPTAGHELVAGGKVSEAVAAGAARKLEAAELTAVTTLRAVRHQVCGDIRTLFAPPAVRRFNVTPCGPLDPMRCTATRGGEALDKPKGKGSDANR